MKKTLSDCLDQIVWEKRKSQEVIEKKTGNDLKKYIEWSKKNAKKLERDYGIKLKFVDPRKNKTH
ncbi:MAG: hypothetical protein HS129_00530 [Leptospiraceae bacterium]|nr:hypothetical protein [Leptospiraceae bacterium]